MQPRPPSTGAQKDAEQAPVDVPDLPGEEGIDLSDAEEQLSEAPREKKNRTDGADGL